MTIGEGERLRGVLHRDADARVAERLCDQLWLRSVLIEQRRRTIIAEREKFDARADRLLALLDAAPGGWA